MSAVGRLATAWEEWDAQCLRRTGRDGRASRESYGQLPTADATRRMEDAVRDYAAGLSLTATEVRVVLVAIHRSGVPRAEAITRTTELFKAAP